MTRPTRQNTEAELDAFEATCRRLSGFDPAIDFEWVDGFLAALAAAPRLPPAEEWLPALCEDAFERAFADPEDHARGLQALQARLHVLCAQLDPALLLDAPDELWLEPLIAEVSDADRETMVNDDGLSAEEAAKVQTGLLWADGFFHGVEAFPALWAPPADEEAPALFDQAYAQVAALTLAPGSEEWRAHVASHYPKGEPTRDELLAEACIAVQDLRLYWVDFAPRTAPRRVEPAPGRNDPCPCGSGRKFKKCHGAAVQGV